jgi:hypothetical protein
MALKPRMIVASVGSPVTASLAGTLAVIGAEDVDGPGALDHMAADLFPLPEAARASSVPTPHFPVVTPVPGPSLSLAKSGLAGVAVRGGSF